MKKKLTLSVVGIFVIAGIIYVSFTKHDTQVPVQDVVTVNKGNVIEKVTAVGNIEPNQVIQVKSVISGTVAQIYHDEGEYVTAGEPLMAIKPQPTPSDYAEKRQQVAKDFVAELAAKKDLQRYEFLLKSKAISKDDQEYAKAKEAYNTAKLTRVLDQQQLSLLEKGKANIGGHDIANIVRAPINGYILHRYIDLGGAVTGESSAQAGSAIYTIADMNDLVFKGQVSELDSAKIHENMTATIDVAAYPKQKITGSLTDIALQSIQDSAADSTDSNTSSSSSTTQPFNVGFNVEVTKLQIPKDIKLLAGYSATADIIVNQAKGALIIPERALHTEGKQNYVWLLQGNAKQPKRQAVQIGLSDGMKVEIKQGLSQGEKILVSDNEVLSRKHAKFRVMG